MTDYLVKLTPLTPFFFGGENTFGEGEETNYFARNWKSFLYSINYPG